MIKSVAAVDQMKGAKTYTSQVLAFPLSTLLHGVRPCLASSSLYMSARGSTATISTGDGASLSPMHVAGPAPTPRMRVVPEGVEVGRKMRGERFKASDALAYVFHPITIRVLIHVA